MQFQFYLKPVKRCPEWHLRPCKRLDLQHLQPTVHLFSIFSFSSIYNPCPDASHFHVSLCAHFPVHHTECCIVFIPPSAKNEFIYSSRGVPYRSHTTFTQQLTMGRGVAWTDVECAHLSNALSNNTQDPIVGIEQTSAVFWRNLFTLFFELRSDEASNKQYNGRKEKAVDCKVESISADLSKFRIATQAGRMFKPTCTTSDQDLSMSIALHLKKRTVVTYEAKYYPHEKWLHHLSYKKLRHLPKVC